MKNIAVLALIGLLSKTETISAIKLNRLEKTNVCISEIHEDTESLLGLDSTISMTEEPAAAEEKSADAKPDPKKEAADAKVAEEETKNAKAEAEATEKEEEAKNTKAVKEEADKKGPKESSAGDEAPGNREVNVTSYLT